MKEDIHGEDEWAMTGPEGILAAIKGSYNVPDDVMSAIRLEGDKLSVGHYNIVYNRDIGRWTIVALTGAPVSVLNDISFTAALGIMVEFAYDVAGR